MNLAGRTQKAEASAGTARRIVVPVEFVAQEPLKQLFVTEETAHGLCDLRQESPAARRQAFWRLRQRLQFTVFPGRLFSYEELQRKVRAATLEKAAIRTANRRHR